MVGMFPLLIFNVFRHLAGYLELLYYLRDASIFPAVSPIFLIPVKRIPATGRCEIIQHLADLTSLFFSSKAFFWNFPLFLRQILSIFIRARAREVIFLHK